MNASTPDHILKAMESVALDDKYTLEHGMAFMSGVQALVKLPMLQRARDALAKKTTAGFISGYRGSPLGTYDQALWKADDFLKSQHIVFQPGVNEELAATAVWGTQQLGFSPEGTNRFDGVFGIWYGKGPGVDRSTDAFKHGNMAGTTTWGGVLAVAGDDHISKSSTLAHQSDQVFQACSIPVFFPTNVQEILDFGIHAFALSRYSGLWSGMKTIQEIVESSATAIIDPDRVKVVIPDDFEIPADGVHIRWPDPPLDQEERLVRYKVPAALAYIRANRLNWNVIEGSNDSFGIVASGKAYNDTRQALANLGLDENICQQVGIRLHKVGVVWPLEPQLAREFAHGLDEILVIEEKRPLLEPQLRDVLYGLSDAQRPRVTGKANASSVPGAEDAAGASPLLRAHADLNPTIIARAIADRLRVSGLLALAPEAVRARIEAHLAQLDNKYALLLELTSTDKVEDRQPWFCSGCPHNTSTRVPEGSRAMAGIGCSFMAVWMDRSTIGYTQMGAEGTPWIGQQPFTTDQHIFANIGDGTYFHSGLLAIRQSIAAGVNITYKILYNDAVAMTGGQQVGERPEGHSVLQIAQSMQAEGVARLVIVTDEPEKYDNVKIAGDPLVKHRDLLDSIQREFREIEGTTAIIYDQTCATEKRRRRKRGTAVDPAKRVIINELVCEGCGDCNVQSNCLSVEPLETEFGRKRAVNQSSCNKDMSCLKGFCPSFVTVEGGQLKKAKKSKRQLTAEMIGRLPEPQLPELNDAKVWEGLVAGVGGTGVITIGQLVGMAARLDGKGIVTQDAAGLAQKGGSTWSHILIAGQQETIKTTRVGEAAADLVLACDAVVAAANDTIVCMGKGRTHVALNRQSAPTAAFLSDNNWHNSQDDCGRLISEIVGDDHVGGFNAAAAASGLMGDAIYGNLMLLGFAWQQGWLPISQAAMLRAIELNAVAVESNKDAFNWGRMAAALPTEFNQALQPSQIIRFTPKETLDSLVNRRVEFLSAYQNKRYAERYRQFVSQVQQREEALLGKDTLSKSVARNLFKLMAYKDEYEVARLHSDPAFMGRITEQFEGDFTVNFHLAPPLLAKRNTEGQLLKSKFGQRTLIAFRMLARMKGLRGTWFDIFARTEERKSERALIDDYRSTIEELLPDLNASNYGLAKEIAELPSLIRGYGHVKERNLVITRAKWQDLLGQWRMPAAKQAIV